ncbi:MAG: hypothetical protein ACPK85_01005 [Methanosarcina sp.]
MAQKAIIKPETQEILLQQNQFFYFCGSLCDSHLKVTAISYLLRPVNIITIGYPTPAA